jgi:uncharacterized delta-60 repeat protein
MQADGKILIGGNFTTLGGQARNNIGRLNPDGSLDMTFNPGAGWTVFSLAVQADGKTLAGGAFTTLAGQASYYLGRLNADGTLDPTLSQGASGYVNALALQPDGKVLVGGSFSFLAGQIQRYIGRLNNSGSATQDLAFDGSSVTWLRGGASPEIWAADFDACTNRTDWFSLGLGIRSGNGWQLTNVAIAADSTIRARGFVAGGYYNGSGWMVEQIVGSPIAATPPRSCTNNAGTVATFTVMAGGTEPLSYQWLKDGVSMGNTKSMFGVQTATLTLSNVLGADAGAYSVVISNLFGSVTSAVATFKVVDPCITVQPSSQTTNLGRTVVFSVSEAGTAPLTFQWRKDGASLAGATAASLALTNVQMADGGNYDVLVCNSFGCTTSAVAALRFIPVDDSFNPGASYLVHALAVQADGKVLVGGLDWLPLQANSLGDLPFHFSEPGLILFPRQFYRLKLQYRNEPTQMFRFHSGKTNVPTIGGRR